MVTVESFISYNLIGCGPFWLHFHTEFTPLPLKNTLKGLLISICFFKSNCICVCVNVLFNQKIFTFNNKTSVNRLFVSVSWCPAVSFLIGGFQDD